MQAPIIGGEDEEERENQGEGHQQPFHVLADLPRPPSQLQPLLVNPISEIIIHTPRVLPKPLLGFWDYAKAALVSTLTLFLYWDNVSWGSWQQRLETSPNALIAAFIIPWVTTLELLENRKLKKLRRPIANYLIDDAQSMGWVWFLAFLCSLPMGGTDYQSSDEEGLLRWGEFILTVIGNTVINTIPAGIIIDHRILLWPFLLPGRLRLHCCPTEKDKITLLKEQREDKYDELRKALQNTFEELPEKILTFPDDKILSYQHEVKLEGDAKDAENFDFLQQLFAAVNAEQPAVMPEQKNGCWQRTSRGVNAVRRSVAPFLEKSLPVLLGIVACGLGITTQTDDVGNTIITGRQWSDDMEMEKAYLDVPFQIMYSGLSLPLSFILTEYFCYEAGHMIGKGIARIIDPKSSLDVGSRFYKKQQFVLTATTLYIGIFSTEANVDMITNVIDRDDVRQYYIDHMSSPLATSWETARSFWLGCAGWGVSFFNSRSLLPLSDDITKAWAMRFGGDLQKVAAHLIFFVEMLGKNFALIRGEHLIAGLEQLSPAQRVQLLGADTAEQYATIKAEIDRLSGEIAEGAVVIEHQVIAGKEEKDDHKAAEAADGIDEEGGGVIIRADSRLQPLLEDGRAGSHGSLNGDAKGLGGGLRPVGSFSIETSPSGQRRFKRYGNGLIESLSQALGLGSRNNSQNRSSRARPAAEGNVRDPLLPGSGRGVGKSPSQYGL